MHQFFSKTETLLSLRRGPLGNYLDRYAAWLSEQGFCRVNARLQLVQIADFSLWLHNRGLTIVGVQPNARGGRLSADGAQYLLAKHLATARQSCPSLREKRVTLHMLRHYLPFLTMSSPDMAATFSR